MNDAPDVLFVCQHGAAKSVIAARHLEALSHSLGIPLTAAAAGVEPDDAIPPHVIAGLREDGIDAPAAAPDAVTSRLLANAKLVIAFDCDLSAFGDAADRVVQWSGVPHVSDGYDAARTEIVRRVQALLSAVPRPDPGGPAP